MVQKCIMGSSGSGSASLNPVNSDLYKVFIDGQTSSTAWPSGIWKNCSNSIALTVGTDFVVGKKYLIVLYYQLSNSNKDVLWTGYDVEHEEGMRFPNYGAVGISFFYGKPTATTVQFNLQAVSGSGILRVLEHDYEL